MIKILCWNVNGIRACVQKGFFSWFEKEKPDILCLQETKAHPDQLTDDLLAPLGYATHWDSAEKKGYSGVANFYRFAPINIFKGIGEKQFDREGRTIITEYPEFVLINAYFPNGQRDHARVPFKLHYCRQMAELCQSYLKKGKEVIVCGDFNTAHREIDLRNPRENIHTTGFLPHERAWIDEFIALGFTDIFREKNAGPHQYTWWSYRPTVRERNIGWRIDYFFVSPGLKEKVKTVYHQPQILGSDHCPIGLELELR